MKKVVLLVCLLLLLTGCGQQREQPVDEPVVLILAEQP